MEEATGEIRLIGKKAREYYCHQNVSGTIYLTARLQDGIFFRLLNFRSTSCSNLYVIVCFRLLINTCFDAIEQRTCISFVFAMKLLQQKRF